MKISVICVGKIKERFFRDAIAEYQKRLSRYCKFEISEVADEKTPDQAGELINRQILEKEGNRILNLLPEDAYVYALAIEGKKTDSVGFAGKLASLGINGKSHIAFVIGGSLGIDEKVKKRANELISFSDMTFPHQLMRVILAEQIYRAFKITANEPYHK